MQIYIYGNYLSFAKQLSPHSLSGTLSSGSFTLTVCYPIIGLGISEKCELTVNVRVHCECEHHNGVNYRWVLMKLKLLLKSFSAK